MIDTIPLTDTEKMNTRQYIEWLVQRLKDIQMEKKNLQSQVNDSKIEVSRLRQTIEQKDKRIAYLESEIKKILSA